MKNVRSIYITCLISGMSIIVLLNAHAEKRYRQWQQEHVPVTQSEVIRPTLTPHPDRIIPITISDSGFSPPTIHVPKNAAVLLKLRSVQGYHPFMLPAYSIATSSIPTDTDLLIDVVATKSGAFIFTSDSAEGTLYVD